MTVTDLHPERNHEPTAAELVAFGHQWFSDVLERRASNNRRWCARWWEHPEVMTRVRVLCLSHRWVGTHGTPLDMSTWMLDHLDRHVDALQSSNGPFASCSPDRHSPHGGLS